VPIYYWHIKYNLRLTTADRRNPFFSVNLTDLKGSVSLAFADLKMTTLYVMDAVIMKTMPMKGQGKFNGTICT